MDIETHLKELAEAYAAGQLDEAEFRQRRAALLEAAKPPVGSEEARDNWHSEASGQDDGGVRTPAGGASLESLQTDLEIGPPNCRFRLLFQLSNSGRVWLAREVGTAPEDRLERSVFRALKIFLPAEPELSSRDLERDEKAIRADLIGLRAYLARIRARVELAAKLDHPHIATVYGWHYGPDGWPLAEMEYVDPREGQSLAQLLERKGAAGLTWEETLDVARPIASALDYAAREYRFADQHLDVDTVFISRESGVRLLSFGLACEISDPPSVLFDTAGAIAGSLPEKSSEASVSDTAFRRDVFALALLIYRMLAGRSAYEAREMGAGALPRPLSLTDAAWQLLRQGLAYPSTTCPTDAGAFIRALEAAQAPMETKSARMPHRRWWLAAGVGILGCLSVYLVGTHWNRESEPVPSQQQTPALPEVAESGDSPAGPGVNAGVRAPQREAEREADLRAFEAAKRVDTLVAYRLYLQRCPACSYRREAEASIQRLETQERIAALKARFEAQVRVLEQEEGSRQEDSALATLETLATVAPQDPLLIQGRQRVAVSYARRAHASLQKNNIGEAKRWLQKAKATQPDLPELTVLAKRLEDAEAEAHSKQQDDETFAAAQRAHTRRAYWAYLERCAPECGHRAQAETALARLAPANAIIRDRLNNGTPGPEMVVIPAGGFQMGSPPDEQGRYNDEQQHLVRIERPFAIGRYEVMFYEYDAFASAAGRLLPSDQGWGRGRRPVINVSWQDAKAYADWLSQQTGYRYRLPTEEEWEYAARAGVTASRYWGNDPHQGCAYGNAADLDGKRIFVGWNVMNCHDGYVYTAPVGSYRDNDFGLYDMLGNVVEWTCSLYDPDNRIHAQGCEEPAGDRQFVVRGGSWSDEPRNVRAADRHRSRPDFRDYFLGFRLLRELP